MNNQAHSNSMNDPYQDEISLTDLIMKLWQRRGLLVVLPVIFLLLAVIYLFFTAVQTNPPTVYFIQLQGIDKSVYPNGTRFSPQDLLIPEVLERAVAQLKLSVNDDLREAIQVEYGVPTTVGIQKKYQQKLAAKNLSATDIEKINSDFQDELRRVSERGLRITVDHASLGLAAEQGAVLASALPRAWTEVFTQKYRVLVDTRLDNVSIVNNGNPLKTTSDILFARNTLRRIGRGLKVLSDDIRLQAIVSQSGFNSADLRSELQRFEELYFRPIFAGLFASPDETAASFMAEIKLQIDEINRNIAELDQSLTDIKGFRQRASERQLADGSRDSVQLIESTLNQVIELANQASLSDYMRQVLADRRDLSEKRAALQTELNRSTSGIMPPKGQAFWESARSEFSTLVKEYVALLSNARQKSRQTYGDFYQPLGAPDVINPALPPRAGLVLVLAVMIGGLIATMAALVWPARSER